jgi:hypothetical protein
VVKTETRVGHPSRKGAPVENGCYCRECRRG